MKDIIQLLPDNIANQIAAGEVVQRPASVVKELMENAVDAKSTEVQVIIKDAGKSLVQVIDNGVGMSETDARLSFERHATSKLRNADDLFAIKTKGFRGEALASIAAIAQVEMKTKRQVDELGHYLSVEGSEVKKQELASMPIGTSVAVKNIFFNVPARRNFLKSNPVEMRHILEDFQRVSIAHADIAFSLFQNDLEVYQLRPANLSQRIVQLFGKNYQQQLVSCSEETTLMQISGYVGKPENAKKTRGEQYFFVNDRFIKNNYLNHAVMSAYEGLLPDRHYPFYALFIVIDPKHVDVNVHPTKTEVKFDDERTVYGIIRAAVKQALGTHNITPSLDFDSDVNFEAIINASKHAQGVTRQEREYGQMKSPGLRQNQIEHWENLYKTSLDESKIDFEGEQPSRIMGSAVNRRENVPGMQRSTMQVGQNYIVTPVKSGLMWVDYRAASERILFEKYLRYLQQPIGASQQLLFPQTISMNPADFALVMELEVDIKALGFAFEQFGKSDLVIQGVPVDAASRDARSLFEGLLEQIKHFSFDPDGNRQEQLARSMAKKVASTPDRTLGSEEMEALIDRLFGCAHPNYAPGGGKTHIVVESEDIDKLFN
jgi:DNA mismatch repair protein MutL